MVRSELAVGRNAVLLVRAHLSVGALADPLRCAVWDVDARQPVPEIATLEGVVAAGLDAQRFRTWLLDALSGIALLMAATGIYRVVAYVVTENTPELGIRMAMGATPGDIIRRVLGWGLRLTLLGVGLGLVGVMLVNRHLAGLPFEVSPTDPATIIASVGVIVLLMLSACLVPAGRAMRLDPAITLRSERAGWGVQRR